MGNSSINKQSISPLELEGYKFPIEPLISVRLKNSIAKNLIAKNKDVGPVVEFWQTEGLEITIQGKLIGADKNSMPDDDIQKITNLATSHKKLSVNCPFLTLFGVEYLVVENMEMPFTPGANNQSFTLNCTQIKPFDLF